MMKFFVPLIAISTLCYGQRIDTASANHHSSSQNTIGKPTLFTYQDVFALKDASDIKISPDGKWVLYVRSSGNIMSDKKKRRIFIINTVTGTEKEWLSTAAEHPLWSPDSKEVIFTAADNTGKAQLFIKEANSPISRQLTSLMHSPQNVSWSPTGRAIAFTMFIPGGDTIIRSGIGKPAGADWADAPKIYEAPNILSDGAGYLTPGHSHIFILSLKDSSVKQITSGLFDEQGKPEWSKDEKWLYFSSRRDTTAAAGFSSACIFRVNVLTGRIQRFLKMPYRAVHPVVSPDGEKVLFQGSERNLKDYERGRLYIMNPDGSGEKEVASSFDFEMDDPEWSPDGQSIYFTYGDKGINKLASMMLNGSTKLLSTSLDGDDEYSFANNGTLVFLRAYSGRPGEVTLLDDHRSRKLTGLNDSLLNILSLSSSKPLKIISSYDGSPVGGWVWLPPAYDSTKRYPVLLKIHGGPHGFDGPNWSAENQLYAAAGYVVLTVNYRGSTSYGYNFANQSHSDYLKKAYADLMSAVDAVISNGIGDPDRLFVMGGSAGGELTTWIIGNTNRFKAAVAEKPIINQISMALTSDQYTSRANHEFDGKRPWDSFSQYWNESPLSLVSHVNTPTMVMVGEEDKRTPPSESIQFYNALQLEKIPVALVLVPGASHESLNSAPSQLGEEVAIVLGWLSRYNGVKH